MDELPVFNDLVPVDDKASSPVAASSAPAQQESLPVFNDSPAPESTPDFHDLVPVDSKESAPDFHSLVPVDEKPKSDEWYQGPLTAVEGAAEALTLGTSTGVELASGQTSKENIVARKEDHPYWRGLGLGVGSTPWVLAAAASAPAAALTAGGTVALSAIGSSVLAGGIAGLEIGASNIISDHALGEDDPEHPVASAITSLGYSGLTSALFSAGTATASTAFKAVVNSKTARAAATALADFGSGIQNRIKAPDLPVAVTNELKELYTKTGAFAQNVRGAFGLNSKAISMLAQEAKPEAVSGHIVDVSNILEEAGDDQSIQSAINNWKAKVAPVANPDAMQFPNIPSPQNSTAVYNATSTLKKELQSMGGYDLRPDQWAELSPSQKASYNNVRKVSSKIVESLEDESAWGKLGKLTKDVNDHWEEFIPSNKDFTQSFTQKTKGDSEVTYDRIKTYFNTIKDPNAEWKPGRLKNYIESAQKFRSGVSDLYAKYGIGEPLETVSLNNTKGTYGEITGGQKLANDIYGARIPKLAGQLASSVVTGAVGHHIGGLPGEVLTAPLGLFAVEMENAAGIKIRDWTMPYLAKALSSNVPHAVADAIEYGERVYRGSSLIRGGVESLFKAGQGFSADVGERDKQKIRDYVDGGGTDQQIQNTLHLQNQTQQPEAPQNFAEGGAVSAKKELSTPIVDPGNKLGSVVPTQAMMLGAAQARVYNYLNAIRPQPDKNPKAPFDDHVKDPEGEKKYDRALTIAAKPLSIIKEIKKGTLTPEHVTHLSQMWPEVHSQLSKEIAKQTTQAQIDGKKPSYGLRQAMSLFVGGSLDSTFNPANIMAAQAVFAKQSAQKAAAAAPAKKQASKNTLSDVYSHYQTPGQASISRQTRERV